MLRMGRMRRLCFAAAIVALGAPAAAYGHAERPSFFPDPTEGSVPQYRTTGQAHVVCKSNSDDLVESDVSDPGAKARNLALLASCDFAHIQSAVNAATTGDRILILPGVYREEPSRAVPLVPDKCKDMTTGGATIPGTGAELPGGESAPTYEFHFECPTAQNLIAIMGDTDPQPDPNQPPVDPQGNWCDIKCNLQIEGTGDTRDDVLIQGDKKKLNVIRADRADGIFLKNFTIEFSDFNNIYALETNGFRFDDIEARFTREYGFLSFTSDNGVYENLDAHHAGDSGIYPGSGPERPGQPCIRDSNSTYGIEIRNVDSHHNTIGWSGTAGNSVFTHDSRFHHNSAGVTMDSFAAGHPGMPQDCSKWEDNRIHSNNLDLFNDERDDYCRQPYPERDDDNKVCPTFQVPEGTGLLTAGGNLNTVENNLIYDNWRQGTMLFSVPAAAREEPDPTKQFDTSWGNQQTTNQMGIAPGRVDDPNGVDFWWDEQNGFQSFPTSPGILNCWQGNNAFGDAEPTSDPEELPTCTGERAFRPQNPAKLAALAPCAAWDPSQEETDSSLPGCDWFANPTEPRPASTGGGGGPGDGSGGGADGDGDGDGDGVGGARTAGGDVDCGDLTEAEERAVLAADPSDPFNLDADGDGVPCESPEEAFTGDGGELPFTGLALALVLGLGIALMATGLVIRRGLRA
jgi:hypothetical protein